jgi:hypothetical protein
MSGDRWDDERLFQEIAAAVAPPEVPEQILRSAEAVYTWRTIDADLAALAFDSALAPAFEPGLRGDQAALRTLTFESRDLVLDLELSSGALMGQVVAPGRVTVELTTLDAPQESTDVTVDEVGFFSVRPAPIGPFKLTLHLMGRHIVTPRISP